MLPGIPAAPFLVIPLMLPCLQQGHSPSTLLMLRNGSCLSPFAFSRNPGHSLHLGSTLKTGQLNTHFLRASWLFLG